MAERELRPTGLLGRVSKYILGTELKFEDLGSLFPGVAPITVVTNRAVFKH